MCMSDVCIISIDVEKSEIELIDEIWICVYNRTFKSPKLRKILVYLKELLTKLKVIYWQAESD